MQYTPKFAIQYWHFPVLAIPTVGIRSITAHTVLDKVCAGQELWGSSTVTDYGTWTDWHLSTFCQPRCSLHSFGQWTDDDRVEYLRRALFRLWLLYLLAALARQMLSLRGLLYKRGASMYPEPRVEPLN
jgi:hypothetical protein